MFIGIVLIGASVVFLFPLGGSGAEVFLKSSVFSQYVGMSALILMAWAQLLAFRWRGWESVFGGYDRIYQLHRWVGVIAFALMYVHNSVDAKTVRDTTMLGELSEDLGSFALNGITVLVIASVLKFLPYHLWRYSHFLMGPFSALAAVHFATASKTFGLTDPLGAYVVLFCAIGALASGLNILRAVRGKGRPYRVIASSPVNGAMELVLEPDNAKRGIPRHKAGQFAFLRFEGMGLDATHPFTLSAAPSADGCLRVSIRRLGDFTRRLSVTDLEGMRVYVEGPYGRFNASKSAPQIWIGAGIGVTPFRAFMQSLGTDGPKARIDMFICASDETAAPHIDEFRAFAMQQDQFHLHEVFTEDGVRLNQNLIWAKMGQPDSATEVYFCGPEGMKSSLKRSLAAKGIKRFHAEAFEIRDDFGLWDGLMKLIFDGTGIRGKLMRLISQRQD